MAREAAPGDEIVIAASRVALTAFTALAVTHPVLPAEQFRDDVAQLPDAPARALVIQYCSACHGLDRVVHAGASEGGWEDRVQRMNRWGAKVPAAEVRSMARYLAAALPPRPRRLTIDTAVTTISVSEVAVHPVQTVVRVAAELDGRGTVLRAVGHGEEAALLEVGQRARAFSAAARTLMHQARVTRIANNGDERTIEATLAAPVGSAGRDYIIEITVDRGAFLSVPNEAVVEDGMRRLVYLQSGASDYVPREITVGLQGERYTQVLSGLTSGEQVVTLGAFFVDAEYRMKGGG
jgi:mono/diheme cytochrome c family protein